MIDPAAQADNQQVIFCPHCGYDLRTLELSACPECGGEVDLTELRKSQIPWVYRADRGRLRALIKTAWAVSSKTKRFCYEIARPVELRDALRFRLAVVWVVYLTLVVSAAAFAVNATSEWAVVIEEFGKFIVWGIIGAAGLMLWVWLYLFTGLHTYWYHPHRLDVEQQNRAIALAYYACGPLLFFPLCVGLFGIGIHVTRWAESVFAGTIYVFGAVICIVAVASSVGLLLAYFLNILRMSHHVARREGLGIISLAIMLPMLWLLAAVLCLALVPAALEYIGLMVASIWF